jgi:cephalosporin hydroxylase
MRKTSHLLRTALGNPAACLMAYLAIRRHYAVQNLWELTHLLAEVTKLRPATVLEIGSHRGGTLYCWSRIMAPDGTAVCLDLPGNPKDPLASDAALKKLMASKTQKCVIIRDDSHELSAFTSVREALGGTQVDFLFIDCDHTYDGVKLDFEFYSQFVRKGGMVAFHDITPHPSVLELGVARFWREVKKSRRAIEFMDPSPGRSLVYGIGVITL